MFAKPQAEHAWLEKLVGEWKVESECQMGPDETPSKMESQLSCRSLGGLWMVAEGESESPEGDTWKTILTIGYDPERKRYVGTFIGSMMTPLWLYSGSVDESGRKLTLDTEGPKFDQSGTARYQDIIEVVDDDHWIMSSQILTDDGNWQSFMTAHHRRTTAARQKEAHEVHAADL